MKKIPTKTMISCGIYLLNFVLLMFLIIPADIENTIVVQVQRGLLIIYLLIAVIHLICVYADKTRKISLLNILIMILFTAFHMQDSSILMGWQMKEIGKMIPVLVLVLTVLEYVIGRFEAWKTWLFQRLDHANTAKHNRLFYHIIWKNFKNNWKDYLMIIICSIILFIVSVVTFSLKEILEGDYGIRKIQVFNGLSEILLNAMIPMAILAIFLIVILVFYYLKTRAKNYGILLTLGMHRKTLYFVTALEFIVVFLVSLIVGCFIGRILLYVIVAWIEKGLEIHLSLHDMSMKPYLYSVGTIVGIIVISFIAAKDIFYDFNVGKSEDMRGIAEKLPGKSRYLYLAMGTILCLYSIIQYRKLYNFENEYLLFVFFIGLLLIIRHGMAELLIRERSKRSYIKKLMIHNQLFHKSKTNAGFITVFTMIQFCILFYFSFQLIGSMIAADVESMFPYDFVCFTDETDDIFFEEMQDKYDLELFEYPMLRVSAYDSTEKRESETQSIKPIQGQHIGISESTYHLLKSHIDPVYEETSLGLDPDGANIHIIYQQDESVKAQPTAFYIPLNEPLLHIGHPCGSVDIWSIRKKDIGYRFYKVKSEEIGSLTGIFHQGIRENIIVFSDEYFEKAKDFWKTSNIHTGEYIEDESMRIPDIFISQGVTKMVLINVNDESQAAVRRDLQMVEKRQLDRENEIYKKITPYGTFSSGIYDGSVSYLYEKMEAIGSIKIERTMKMIMSISAMILFVFMNIMIFVVKMLSELELNVKRAEFLNCMGMRQKEREKLIRIEIMRYYGVIPAGIAVVGACVYVDAVFKARMYTLEDIRSYLGYMLPAGCIYIVGYLVIMLFVTKYYINKIEKLK